MSDAQELRRLAAKQGWYDGYADEDPCSPVHVVRMRGGDGNNPGPQEEDAYWQGYFEGQLADEGALNPTSTERVTGPPGTFLTGVMASPLFR